MKFISKFLCRIVFIFVITLLPAAFNLTYADYNQAKIVQHTGKILPLDLKFINSNGDTVQLKNLIDKPTVIDFCYYRCTGICTPLMTEIAGVIGKVKYNPGKDYDIISISIDQNETPELAAQRKHEMVGLINRTIPDSAWVFLTGDSTNIYKLTGAAGFYFKRSYGGFLHKGVLIFIDKDGKIVQYLSPGYDKKGNFRILPSGFEVAIEGAQAGQISSTIAGVLKTCYTFIPKGKDFWVLILVLATGVVVVITVLTIIKKVNPKKS